MTRWACASRIYPSRPKRCSALAIRKSNLTRSSKSGTRLGDGSNVQRLYPWRRDARGLFEDALIGVRGLLLQRCPRSAAHFKTIEKEGMPGGWGANKYVGRPRHIHAPGIQQEPRLFE